MDRDRLCAFFNRLQVLQGLSPLSALGEMVQAIRHLDPTSIGAQFAVVRDGVAALLIQLPGLSQSDRYSILKAVLTARDIETLTQVLDTHGRQDAASDARVTGTLVFIRVGCHDRRRCRLHHLAKRVTLSPWHLSRLVHRHTGRTLTEHIRRARVEKASALLLSDPHVPLRLIAKAVGYRDDTDLCHNFKHVLGCSPKQYLRLRQS